MSNPDYSTGDIAGPRPSAPPATPITVTPIVNDIGTTTGQAITTPLTVAITSGATVSDYVPETGWVPRPDPMPRPWSHGQIGGTVPPAGDNPQKPDPPAA